MYWNYRAIKHNDEGDEHYSIHEVYYDDHDKPSGCTSEPVSFTAQDPANLIKWLEQAIKDLRSHPVFVPPKEWDNLEDDDVCPFCKQPK